MPKIDDLSFLLRVDVFKNEPSNISNLQKTEQDAIAKIINNKLKDEIQKKIGTNKPNLTQTLKELNLDFRNLNEEKLNDVIKNKLFSISNPDKNQLKEIDAIKKKLSVDNDVEIIALLNTDVSIDKHPMLGREYRKQKALLLAKLLQLNKTNTSKLSKKDLRLNDPHDTSIQTLVTEKIITIDQKKKLQLLINLDRLTGGNYELIQVLNEEITSFEELIPKDQSDWKGLLLKHKITLPLYEVDADSYAKNICLNIEKTFPSKYFLARISKKINSLTENTFNITKTLLEKKQIRIRENKIELIKIDESDFTAQEKQEIANEVIKLNEIICLCPQLKITDVLHDNKIALQDKYKQVIAIISAMSEFISQNNDIDLYNSNFFTSINTFKWDHINTKFRPLIIKQFATYQRMLVLLQNSDLCLKLLLQGFESANSISKLSANDFCDISGLGFLDSQLIYKKAQDIGISSINFVQSLQNMQFDPLSKHLLKNRKSIVNDLRDFDGYDEIFGSQNYCDCEDCRSIIGPAAYFADLMHFVEEHISKKIFHGIHSNHPLYLKNRRPDLWSLKLTCENTNHEIPYLQIVNEVLEQFISGDQTDVYSTLQNENQLGALPFCLPLEEIRLYLGHFDLSLDHIFKRIGEPSTKYRMEKLKISEMELGIIITPDADKSFKVFQKPNLKKFKVSEFIKSVRISREQFEQLINIKSFPEISHVKVKIVSDDNETHNHFEILTNLKKTNLDLIYRFLRLWKKTPWSIEEFDLLICTCIKSSLLRSIESTDSEGNPEILLLADLINIQEKLTLSVEELCILISDIPTSSINGDKKGYIDRVFDREKIFGINQDVLIPRNKNQDQITMQLTSGLGISETQIADLFTFLLVGDESGITINESVLAKLLRHVIIATKMNLSIEELIKLCKLLDIDQVKTIAHINNIIEFMCWLETSPFSISELSMIINEEEGSQIKYENDKNSAVSLLTSIDNSFTENFRIQIKKYLIDTYILNSNQISNLEQSNYSGNQITEILKSEEISNEIYSSSDSLDMEILNIKNRTLPNKFDLFKMQLVSKFNLSMKQLEEEILSQLIDSNIFNDDIQKILYLQVDELPAHQDQLNQLISFIRKIESTQLFFSKLEFSSNDISLFIRYQSVLGISNLKKLSLHDIQLAVSYKNLLSENEDYQTKIIEMLALYEQIPSLDTKLLADIWCKPERLIQSIIDSFDISQINIIEKIDSIRELTNICHKLGIEGQSLYQLGINAKPISQPIIEPQVEQLQENTELLIARDIAVAAVQASCNNSSDKKEIESYQEIINTLKREALCDYILSQRDTYKFDDHEDLYKFFLLDVDMGGCFHTSRIASAISSVQLYIHRCLLKLEQSDPFLNSDIVDIKVNSSLIPENEWEWRKNYRVWEANRKVFLFPENYIDPTLRSDKTHIFEELEDELLQEEINQASAEKAYKKYLAQFTELTKLRYAGAFYHRISDTTSFLDLSSFSTFKPPLPGGTIFIPDSDAECESEDSKYYLFAHTNTQPYQYYYREYNHYKNIWGNWKKIDLAIEADEISALIHQGKLYIFWTEVQSKEITNFKDGNSKNDGVEFKVFMKYAFLDQNNTWSSPQRVYIGFTHTPEERIFHRIIQNYPTDDIDKMRDAVTNAYKKEVFRKPYSSLYNNLVCPIVLSYIWAKNQDIHEDIYTVGGWCCFDKYHIYIDTTSFTILNSQWTNMTKEINFTGYYTKTNFSKDEIRIRGRGTLYLLFPFLCVFCCVIYEDNEEMDKDEDEEKIFIPLPVSQEIITQHVSKTTHGLSLSKNNLTEESFKDIEAQFRTITQSSFLAKEYNLIFGNYNDSYAHYVEDGTREFTARKKIIKQCNNGEGHICIPNENPSVDIVPLSANLTDELSDILFSKGLKDFLSLNTQMLFDAEGRTLDFNGAYGKYYWEMFFHIPFLIANHLNVNQQFKEAKWWYERIFNPTAIPDDSDSSSTDYNWQFREFRGLTLYTVEDILTNQDAIRQYRENPFDPNAIAQLRLSAYQKVIVMKYIDNLMDWGDQLFSQDTVESINEAEMLYQLAADILGERPEMLGKCQTTIESDLTYSYISEKITDDSEFLIEMENLIINLTNHKFSDVLPMSISKHLSAIINAKENESSTASIKTSAQLAQFKCLSDVVLLQQDQQNADSINFSGEILNTQPDAMMVTDISDSRLSARLGISTSVSDRSASNPIQEDQSEFIDFYVPKYDDIIKKKMLRKKTPLFWEDSDLFRDKISITPPFGLPIFDFTTRKKMIFCTPPNNDLIHYWDEVENRLFYIRNCMNIDGIPRTLAQFQPQIDPMLLVKAKSMDISIEEILSGLGKTPVYRFTFLIEKAKQITKTVQGFGSNLLSALEKKDIEELTLLRSIHERNILSVTNTIKKQQVTEAQYQKGSLYHSKMNIQNRINHFQQLTESGLNVWERTQQLTRHVSSRLQIREGVLRLMAGIGYLVPNLGSPFAITYGGKQFGDSASGFANCEASFVKIAEAISASAGLEATFRRRQQDWCYQLALAKREFSQVEKQLLAAEIRESIAQKDYDMHQKNIEQAEEIAAFYKDKSSNLGLYQYLASTLTRLYRESYSIAFDIAQMAESAYQFEIDRNEFFIEKDNWQYNRLGLLAGEKLLLQLQKMEQSYLENNQRATEINQSFSLAFLDPSELISLRQTGKCKIKIPEIAFDIVYPGQYKRIIKSVRLTIPCVVGPYTNISAKLTLLKSEVQIEKNQGLIELLIGKNTSICTSSAINDSGLFDFNFRDERYLPFEGSGAISEWLLELPAIIRSFDYSTISDVILRLSYTAKDGEKQAAEDMILESLTDYSKDTGLFRLFSMKHEFPSALNQLLTQSEKSNRIEFEIKQHHFPAMLKNFNLSTQQLSIYFLPKNNKEIELPEHIKLSGVEIDIRKLSNIAFPNEEGNINRLFYIDIKDNTNIKGSPFRLWTIEDEEGELKNENIDDILFLFKYGLFQEE